MSQDARIVSGTAVALGGRGALIRGAPGSGKSSLALDMISRGATLVADDRVSVTQRNTDDLIASAPEPLAGMIEARGIGILTLPHTTVRLVAVIDLDATETARLPKAHQTVIAGVALPCLAKVESPVFAAMVLAYLKGGRMAV